VKIDPSIPPSAPCSREPSARSGSAFKRSQTHISSPKTNSPSSTTFAAASHIQTSRGGRFNVSGTTSRETPLGLMGIGVEEHYREREATIRYQYNLAPEGHRTALGKQTLTQSTPLVGCRSLPLLQFDHLAKISEVHKALDLLLRRSRDHLPLKKPHAPLCRIHHRSFLVHPGSKGSGRHSETHRVARGAVGGCLGRTRPFECFRISHRICRHSYHQTRDILASNRVNYAGNVRERCY